MKVKIGRMVCETKRCGNTVVVKKNENGTLSYRCDECDKAPYARVGTGEYNTWMEDIQLDQPKEATPAIEPQPAQKQSSGFFG